MESKVNMFKKVTVLTGDEVQPKQKKIQSGNKNSKKKKGDAVADKPFNMVAINHFHEVGMIDPIIQDFSKKGSKNVGSASTDSLTGSSTVMSAIPYPSHIEKVNVAHLSVAEACNMLIYPDCKYNDKYPPVMNYLPHDFIVKKLVYVIAEQLSSLDENDKEFGGRLDHVKKMLGIVDYFTAEQLEKMNQKEAPLGND